MLLVGASRISRNAFCIIIHTGGTGEGGGGGSVLTLESPPSPVIVMHTSHLKRLKGHIDETLGADFFLFSETAFLEIYTSNTSGQNIE